MQSAEGCWAAEPHPETEACFGAVTGSRSRPASSSSHI